ncbi:MAG: T9SS type A sorting domain-containing protein [Crocinitomicaceae bacterium]
MKKIYASFIFVSTAIYSFAQPNINGSDINAVVGEQITITRATAMQPDGPNASNVTWDFSSATPMSNSTISMSASDAAHPGTNLVYDYAGQAQLYYQMDNTLQSVKYQFASGVLINFSDQMKLMEFPLNNNTNFTDAFAASFNSGGINFARSGTTTITYMGYGTMITPNGTYSSCIKIKMEQIYSDVFVGGTINYNTTGYYWYKAGYHYPIASSVTFTDDLGTNEQYTDYYGSSSLSVSQQDLVDFQLYPNPTHDNLFISLPSNLMPVEYSISDNNGKEVMQIQNSNTSIDLSNLASGMYFLSMTLKDGSILRKTFQKL